MGDLALGPARLPLRRGAGGRLARRRQRRWRQICSGEGGRRGLSPQMDPPLAMGSPPIFPPHTTHLPAAFPGGSGCIWASGDFSGSPRGFSLGVTAASVPPQAGGCPLPPQKIAPHPRAHLCRGDDGHGAGGLGWHPDSVGGWGPAGGCRRRGGVSWQRGGCGVKPRRAVPQLDGRRAGVPPHSWMAPGRAGPRCGGTPARRWHSWSAVAQLDHGGTAGSWSSTAGW